jgi:cytidine deaminase
MPKKLVKQLEILLYESVDEISPEKSELINKAKEACELAYAPYSRFSVGAAILTSEDQIVLGSNQENASYPLGLCAERVALFRMANEYPGQSIKALAVTSASEFDLKAQPLSPCGACRQVIDEFSMRLGMYPILLAHANGQIWEFPNVESLLPWAFRADFLQ